MDAQTVGQIIQLILAPVVMITSCSLVLGGLVTRYGSINDRLRLMAQERLQLIRSEHSDNLSEERLTEIDQQLPDLLRRHKQVHDAVLLVYLATFMFLCDMFVIALLVVSGLAWISSLVLVFFLGGLLALMIAVAIAVLEIYRSHFAVRFEVERIAMLKRLDR